LKWQRVARFEIPLAVGNSVEILGIAVAVYLIVIAPDISDVVLRFLVYLISWGCSVFFPHCLAHFVTGRLVGIRFKYYLLTRSPLVKLKLPLISAMGSMLPVLGLRIDHSSLGSIGHGARAVMFTSGTAASMVFPFFPVAASIGRLPVILSSVLLVLSAANVLFGLYYSPKLGDISRI
jgi:hypothetical protein